MRATCRVCLFTVSNFQFFCVFKEKFNGLNAVWYTLKSNQCSLLRSVDMCCVYDFSQTVLFYGISIARRLYLQYSLPNPEHNFPTRYHRKTTTDLITCISFRTEGTGSRDNICPSLWLCGSAGSLRFATSLHSRISVLLSVGLFPVVVQPIARNVRWGSY